MGDNVNTQEWLSQGNPLVGLSFSRPHDRLYSLNLDVAKLTTNTGQSGVNNETGVTDATNATSAGSEPVTPQKKLVRTWTSRSGKQMQAEFLSYDPKTQKLSLHRLTDDKNVSIAVTAFSDDDQAFIKELVAAEAE